jgi:two-component system, NarL family, sensor kinase
MKYLLYFFLFLLQAHPHFSQVKPDSLQEVLNNATINRNTLQYHLARIEKMDLNEMKNIQVTAEWVIKKANADSLREIQAAAYLALGKAFTTTLSFEDATRYLTTALHIAEPHHFDTIRAQALNSLGTIYDKNEQNEKALHYYQQSLQISRENNYLPGIALATLNLGRLHLQESNRSETMLRSALNEMLEAFRIVHQLKDTAHIISFSSEMVNAYLALKQYDAAFTILNDAEKLIKATGKKVAYVRHYNRVAKIYNNTKQYPAAIQYYNTGLALAREYKIPRWLCMYYTGLAETYENIGDYKKANWYNQLNIKMHDALVSAENFAAAADIQNRYERAKKDNAILQLAAANKQKLMLNKIFIGATLALLFISILGYWNFKHRQKIAYQQQELQNQKIAELEKDKQLSAIDAMLKGQEEERSRIAKDLHDGLGGLLSGTKLSFMNVKENLLLTKENAALFDKSLGMLDNTISDLRKVAHNLMPETLIRFGLNDSLRDFCDTITSSSGIIVIYQRLGEDRTLSSTAEVFTYRIVQELVNNALKHAGARQIIVQLSINKHTVGIVVEDDGKGFHKTGAPAMKGTGITNIQSRVQYLNGNMDIITSPGNGTSVNIELKA